MDDLWETVRQQVPGSRVEAVEGAVIISFPVADVKTP
jgi:hypothetical protein